VGGSAVPPGGYQELPTSSSELNSAMVARLGPLQVATGNTTTGINGKEILVSGIADLTAGGAAAFVGGCDGAKARFARANREGGVNGYTIKYLGCDDTTTSPDTATQLIQKAVLQDKVFAMVPISTFVASAANAALLNKNHVPYFGFGVDPAAYCGWNDLQFAFSVTSASGCTGGIPVGLSSFSSSTLVSYLKATKKDPGSVKLALIGSDTPDEAQAINGEVVMAKAAGMQVVYSQVSLPGPTAPPPSDYTSFAQAIINSGANLVFPLPATVDELVGLSSALKSNGFKGDELQFTITTEDALAVSAIAQALDGAYAVQPMGTVAYPSPQFDQITADLKAISSPAPASSEATLTSYGAADLFLSALSKVQGPLTTEALAAVLNSGYTYPGYGNALCPTIWPADHLAAFACVSLSQIQGTKVKGASDLGDQGGKSYVIRT
jgi:ABC-type branched-subunit amino acid transport system substrate-binding protein